MADISDYHRSDNLYKQRKEAGKIPLHTSVAVSLAVNPVPTPKATRALKLISLSMAGMWIKTPGGKFFAAVIYGYYEEHVIVEKRFVDGMASDDLLPTVVYRDVASLKSANPQPKQLRA